MRAKISSNAGVLYQRMRRRGKAVERELALAARTLAPEIEREDKRIMNAEIYDVEIPFRSSTSERVRRRYAGTSGGQRYRLWKRTRNLLNRERVRARDTSIYLTNDALYAVHRYLLGTSRGRAIRTPTVRSVQWQEEAVRSLARRIREVRRRHVLRGILK